MTSKSDPVFFALAYTLEHRLQSSKMRVLQADDPENLCVGYELFTTDGTPFVLRSYECSEIVTRYEVLLSLSDIKVSYFAKEYDLGSLYATSGGRHKLADWLNTATQEIPSGLNALQLRALMAVREYTLDKVTPGYGEDN